jgi:hypothetical protein
MWREMDTPQAWEASILSQMQKPAVVGTTPTPPLGQKELILA